MRNKIISSILIFCMMLSLTACGGGSSVTSADTATESYEVAEDGAVYENEWDESEEDLSMDSGEEMSKSTETDIQENSLNKEENSRKLIKTVNMEVETLAFDKLTASVRKQAELLGGYIESSNVYHTDYYGSGSKSAEFVVRIPQNHLDKFTNKIQTDGNVIRNEESVEDVTLNYVDIQSHITALKEEQKRLNELVSQAENLDEVLLLEGQLTQVRYELQNYESQKRVYDNQVSYSTVNLSISEVEEITEVEEKGVLEQMCDGFMKSLHVLGEGIVQFSIFFVSALPILVFFAMIILLVFFVIKKAMSHKKGKREKKHKKKREEIFELLNPDGTKTGRVKPRTLVHRDGDLHGGSHIWILGKDYEDGSFDLLLQRRAQDKDAFPGCLDVSSAGHLTVGEDFVTAAVRELEEELNLKAQPQDLTYLFTQQVGGEYFFHGHPFKNHEINQVFLLRRDFPLDTLKFQEGEIAGLEWKNSKEVLENIKNGNTDYCVDLYEIEHLIEAMKEK